VWPGVYVRTIRFSFTICDFASTRSDRGILKTASGVAIVLLGHGHPYRRANRQIIRLISNAVRSRPCISDQLACDSIRTDTRMAQCSIRWSSLRLSGGHADADAGGIGKPDCIGAARGLHPSCFRGVGLVELVSLSNPLLLADCRDRRPRPEKFSRRRAPAETVARAIGARNFFLSS